MPIYTYDCGVHITEIFKPAGSGQIWPRKEVLVAPRVVPCLNCMRSAKRIIVAPYVNDDLPLHDQSFRELVPHDPATRARWEKDGRVFYEGGLPRARCRSRSEFKRAMRELGRCTAFEGSPGGELAVNQKRAGVRGEVKKTFKKIARESAEKIIRDRAKNPAGLTNKTAKQIIDERAKKAGAVNVGR